MGSEESGGFLRAKDEQGMESTRVSRAGLQPAKDPMDRDMRRSQGKKPQKSSKLPD